MMHFRLLAILLLFPASTWAAEPSFSKEGVVFVKQFCLNCHSGDKPKADLSLKAFLDDSSLIKDRKTWNRVREVILAGEMPPPNKPQPTASEREAFLNLVAGVFDRFDKNAKPDPGRVTMRRLNRNEYHYTIRDLIGIDFNPAEDFPSDDVGHGFDNIGDVLSLPPVLLERYLAAAETIMEKAITPVPPKVVNRAISSRYTEPASANVPMEKNYRIISTEKKDDPVKSGPVNTPYQVLDGEEYEFVAKIYATSKDESPVKVAILAICDKTASGIASDDEVKPLYGAAVQGLRPFVILKIHEVKAKTEKEAEEIKVRFKAPAGFKRTAIALLAPEKEESAPKLFLERLGLNGPLDSRPRTHRTLLKCDETKSVEERSREVISRFATRAYRRPLAPEELNRLLKFAQDTIARGEKWEKAMQLTMQAILVSPKFLFRVELDDRPTTPESHPLDEYQLASRLSYFLWASMPDEELFALAAKKELTANLETQVKRMLKSPKATTLVDHFALQWLQLQNLKNLQPDVNRFPQFNDRLRAAMLEETRLFLSEVIREDRSILTLLDSDFTYLNSSLARLYGIRDTAGNRVEKKGKEVKPNGQPIPREGFVRVSLSGTDRGGLLTQASVLTVTSNPTRTSPVKRGRWVLEQILGTPPPPPPPNVPELEQDGKPVNAGSLRQQMELHRKNVACANCHAKMDPLGFGLESFDAIGGFREKDGEFAIDASGELPDGQKFNGPKELKTILLGKKELFSRCLTEKMMIYGLGRGLEYYDKRPIDRIMEKLPASEYRFSSLVLEIVRSDPFRLRRGTEQKD